MSGVTLVGGAGGDALNGTIGADSLVGLAGDDSLYGGGGGTALEPGQTPGADTLVGGAGDDGLYSVSYPPYRPGVAYRGFASANSVLLAGAGNDSLDGAGTMVGGTGDDSIHVWDGARLVIGGSEEAPDAGNDTISFSQASDPLRLDLNASTQVLGADSLIGTLTSDFIQGYLDRPNRLDGWLGGADTLVGGNLDDVLRFTSASLVRGGGGADTLDGAFAAGATLEGGAGNDWLQGGALLIGGAGDDSIRVYDPAAQTIIGGTSESPDDGFDTISFAPYNTLMLDLDTIAPIAGADVIEGASRSNVIQGYRDAPNRLQAAPRSASQYDQANDATLIGGNRDDMLTLFDRGLARGGAGDDTLTGGTGASTLEGGAGDDVIRPQGRNPSAVLLLSGDADGTDSGSDTLDLTAWEGPLGAEFGGLTWGAGFEVVILPQDRIISVARNASFTFVSAGAATLTGTAGRETLAGDDLALLRGGGGGDSLYGLSNSTLEGQAGDDRLKAIGGALRGGEGHDRLSLMVKDGVAGWALMDGGAGDDRLEGWGTLIGGAGDDTLVAPRQDSTQRGGDGDDQIFGLGRLFGEAGADRLEALYSSAFYSAEGWFLSGGDGDDTLVGLSFSGGVATGGAGNDLIWGAGRLSGEDGDDRLDSRGGSADMRGGSGNDTLLANVGTLRGEDGDDFLFGGSEQYGGAGNDRLDLRSSEPGEAGDRRLARGGSGDDLIIGGAFQDDLHGDTGADTAYAGAGNDTVDGDADADLLDGGTGYDLLVGGDGDDRLYGLQDHDTLLGGEGADTLGGGLGNDVLDSGAGGDLLIGGAGRDRMVGGAGADTLAGGGGDDTIVAGPDAAVDVVRGWSTGDRIETIGLGLPAFIGTDAFTGVAAAVRYAWRGRETVVQFDANGDGAADGGLTIRGRVALTAADFMLAPPVTPDGGVMRIGDERPDRLVGGPRGDSLAGLEGNDALTGEGGADTLDGGAGNDALSALSHWARERDDVGDLMLGADGQDTLTGAFGADTLEGGDGADRLIGDGGHDLLSGGAGNDTLDAGWGADTLLGGDGDDVLIVNDYGALLIEPDLFLGGGGDDLARGSVDADTLRGEAGADTLVGQYGADLLQGGAGNDLLGAHFGGDDNIGNPQATAGYALGGDTLQGEDGDDRLISAGGNTLLLGGEGADTLHGGIGWLEQRNASGDTLQGGAGDDLFAVLWGSREAAPGMVADWHVGDRIQAFILHGPSMFHATNPAEIATTFIGTAPFTRQELTPNFYRYAAEMRYVVEGATTRVEWDGFFDNFGASPRRGDGIADTVIYIPAILTDADFL